MSDSGAKGTEGRPMNPQDIRKRVMRLQRRDKGRRVFGSKTHQYESCKLLESEVAKFEDGIGAFLPKDYRSFLIWMGHGAGPYYGIFGLEESLAETESYREELLEEYGLDYKANADFPIDRNMCSEIADKLEAKAPEPWLELPFPVQGCIIIGHQGCTFWTVLAVSGELAGTVWDVACNVGNDGMWLPAGRPTGVNISGHPAEPMPSLSAPCSFEEWFLGWLDRCEKDLEGVRYWLNRLGRFFSFSQ